MLLQALCIISKPAVNSNWSYSPETLNFGQNWWFFVPCDLEIWQMPLEKIGHLFYITSSFVHHFTISEFKLELPSGNDQFGSKLVIFFVLCDLEIRRMTLKNNWAHLLYYVKLHEAHIRHSSHGMLVACMISGKKVQGQCTVKSLI